MKKIKKTFSVKLAITIILIILIILYSLNQNNRKIRESNIGFTKAVKCMRNCPVEAQISIFNAREIVSQNCIKECMLKYDKEIHIINTTKKNYKNLLITNAEPTFSKCLQLLKEEAEKLYSCLDNWLKEASQQYSYVRNVL